MPTNKKYNLQTYNSGLKKLEAQVGRASTPQKRKKAKAAIAAYRKTRSKYTAKVKNPANKLVRNIASQAKAKAKPGIKKVKRAVSAVKKRSQRVADSGATQKRLTIQKLTKQLRSLKVGDPKREAVRKKLVGAKSSSASVFARARATSPTKKVAKKRKPTVTRRDQISAKMGTMRKSAIKKARGIARAESPSISMQPKTTVNELKNLGLDMQMTLQEMVAYNRRNAERRRRKKAKR